MFGLRKRYRWIAPAAFVIGVVGAMVYWRNPTEPLTRAGLQSARGRWRKAGIESYDMTFNMLDGRYDVKVRKGRVTSLTRNGAPAQTSEVGAFTVEGLFDILERELDMMENQTAPDDPRRRLLRVHFDPRLGYVDRFIRPDAGGMGGAELKVEGFNAVASPAE